MEAQDERKLINLIADAENQTPIGRGLKGLYERERLIGETCFKAGIKEVMGDIENKFMVKDSPNPDFLPEGLIFISKKQWQELKKSKGIE